MILPGFRLFRLEQWRLNRQIFSVIIMRESGYHYYSLSHIQHAASFSRRNLLPYKRPADDITDKILLGIIFGDMEDITLIFIWEPQIRAHRWYPTFPARVFFISRSLHSDIRTRCTPLASFLTSANSRIYVEFSFAIYVLVLSKEWWAHDILHLGSLCGIMSSTLYKPRLQVS